MKANFKEIMAEHFGAELSSEQLWALVKFAKNVRLRCRSNAAFNNFMNATFPYATFRQVQKSRPSRINPAIQESYEGLQITIKGKIAEDQDTED